MPTFDVKKEPVNLFDFGDIYLFKEYFDQDQLFDKLDKCHNRDKHRFEVSEGKVSKVSQVLEEHFYGPRIINEIEKSCVAIKTADEDQFKCAVLTQRQGNYEVFMMKNELSVGKAAEKGGKPVEKTGLELEEIQWQVR